MSRREGRDSFFIAMPVRMGAIKTINSCLAILPCLLLSWFCCIGISHSADTLRAGEVMRDWQFLESPGQIFRLQFFSPVSSSDRNLGSPDSSSNCYLVIRQIDDFDSVAAWVANRENPLMDTSGVLNLIQAGNLVITDDWGTYVTINSDHPAKSSNTNVTLLDTANLVLREWKRIVWQSFDYPSDTLLPGMKLGWFDLKMGRPHNRSLTSWLSPQVAAQGGFTLGVDPNNTKQFVIWRRGVLYWRSGIWNDSTFSHLIDDFFFKSNFRSVKFSYFANENESYFTFAVINSTGSWIKMNSSGEIEIRVTKLGSYTFLTLGPCDDDANEGLGLKGCLRPEPSRCRGGDTFSPLTDAPSGEFEFLDILSLGLSDCKEICLRNCSCSAYASRWSNGTGRIFAHGQKKNSACHNTMVETTVQL